MHTPPSHFFFFLLSSVYSWTEGCQPLANARDDFGEHTVLSTEDYTVEADASLLHLPKKLFLFASFNDHIIHHMFPTVDLSKQYLLRPLFLQLVEKFQVPYTSRSFSQLLIGTFAAMHRKKGDLKFYPRKK